ncbi:MAG: DUF4230 domain-containing protein [Actinobacteria bacterium]|nr:DUF4230 domain-containing protein [Actinomycetota bacterium]MCI0545172.1 DUF4230 domain-containing protein [Actinomycetota bacterium]
MDTETGSQPAPPRSRRLLPAMLPVVAIVAIVVWGVIAVISAIPTPGDIAEALAPEPYEEIGPVVVTAIRDLAALTTVESVQYTIVEKGTDRGWLAWARGDNLVLFAVARIGAGVDLSRVSVRDITVDELGVVEITVPSAEIQYVAPDNEATQILDRDIGLFTRGDPQLESETRRVADEVLAQSALDNGILEKAEENAREVLTNFLLSLGYRDVIVEFSPAS